MIAGRHLVPLLSAVLLVGCAGDQSRAEPEQPASSPGPDTRSEDIELCVHALHRPVGVAAQIEACRHLWLEPGCRDAWAASLASEPGRRGEYVIARCAQAYCVESSEELVCTTPAAEIDLLDEEVDWLDEWSEFNAVVLTRDLELEEGDRRGAVIARRLLQLVATSGAGVTVPTSTETDVSDEAQNEPSDSSD